MSLLSYIVQGFGWKVGSEVAKEAIDELRQQHAGEPVHSAPRVEEKPAEEPPGWWARQQAARAKRRDERQRQQAEQRAAREIDEELAVLKRRMRDD